MKNYEGTKGNVVEMQQEEDVKCSNFLKFCVFLHGKAHFVVLGLLVMFIVPDTVFANQVNADNVWDTIMGEIQTWVMRLGAVVMFVGGIMFGMGWKNDDAEQKSRGVSSMIAGAIVIAISALTDELLLAGGGVAP